jgi:hypothetical protein
MKFMTTFGSLQRILEEDKELVNVFFKILDKHIKRKGKKRLSLRFAKQTTYGWSFFTKKYINWDDLTVITKEVAKQHQHCPFHVIAEKISYLINITDKNLLPTL